ncbi:MAG: hypothetical protein M1817_004087 [Caeruleum heppii]|nr:MAG: hypothetical protein M1817_004087 [Caeruleum heppii]
MARPLQENVDDPGLALINLTRLLSRLENIILKPDVATEDRLRKSHFERTRVGANVEYARTLLLKLEHEASNVKLASRKSDRQADLYDKRALIKRFNNRLRELDQLDVGTDQNAEDDAEDLFGDSVIEDRSNVNAVGPDISDGVATSVAATDDRNRLFATQTSSEESSSLRSRRQQTTAATDVGASTSSSIPSSLSTTEQHLSHNRSEQEDLTSSLVTMAQALKASSQAFASSLESEKEILDRAGEGLEKNTSGMEAAEKRMGTLRRMTEGRGFLGRLLMYAWIAGLMMVALFIVGFLPKLRF